MKAFISIIIFLLSLYADISLRKFTSFFSVNPDFFLLFLYFTALYQGKWKGIIYGFLGGFFLDLYTPSTLGLKTLLYTTMGYFLETNQNKFYRYKTGSILLLFLITFFVHLILLLFSGGGTFFVIKSIFSVVLVKSIYTTLIGIIIVIFIKKGKDAF